MFWDHRFAFLRNLLVALGVLRAVLAQVPALAPDLNGHEFIHLFSAGFANGHWLSGREDTAARRARAGAFGLESARV
jgi:hypothetical protein